MSLASVLNLESWMTLGICAQTDPDAFFPEQGVNARNAKATCRRCPVKAQCLQYALDNDERYGVWGGLSERERRRVLNGEIIPDHQIKAAS